jgi:type IV pilus assembly protein PilO
MQLPIEKFRGLINKVNEKNPYYLLIALLFCILIVFYLFPIQFQFAALQAISPKITQMRQDLETTQNNIQRKKQYQDELQRHTNRLEDLRRRIKRKEEIPLLLENISRIAGQHGVSVVQLMPQTTLDEPILENKDGRYFSIPIVIEAQSGFHQFGAFINELEREGVFLRLPRFSIAAGSANSRQQDIEMTMEVVIFEQVKK